MKQGRYISPLFFPLGGYVIETFKSLDSDCFYDGFQKKHQEI